MQRLPQLTQMRISNFTLGGDYLITLMIGDYVIAIIYKWCDNYDDDEDVEDDDYLHMVVVIAPLPINYHPAEVLFAVLKDYDGKVYDGDGS